MWNLSNDAVITKDLKGIITSWNKGAEEFFGYSADEIIGQPILRLIPPDRVTEEEQISSQIKQDQLVGHFETMRLKKDGTLIDVSITVSPVKDKNGTIIGASKITRDISEHQQAEKQFQLAIESAPNAIVMVNKEGKIVLVNSRTENYFGYIRTELVGNNVDVLVPEPFRNGHTNYRTSFYKEPALRAMGVGRELYGLRKDGSEFPVEIGLAPIETPEETFVMATVVDITARRHAETELQHTMSELQRSNTELEQFAYVASHDLQEPLRMVSSYLQLIERRYKGKLNSDADEFINFAVDGARRMQGLIEDLLAFSRVGTQGRPFEPVDANTALDRALKNLDLMIGESSATITRTELPTLNADPVQLIQLFQNLIGNGIKFCRPGEPPHIEISVVQNGSEWEFNVRDNGIGIDPQFAERIFVIFQRLHSRGKYPGTGIGLAICKKIVERHGGYIWVDSQPNTGASFYFTFPMLETGGQL